MNLWGLPGEQKKMLSRFFLGEHSTLVLATNMCYGGILK